MEFEPTFYTGTDFGLAACKVLALDPSRTVIDSVQTGLNDPLAAKVTIYLTPHDLYAIGKEMRGSRRERQVEPFQSPPKE